MALRKSAVIGVRSNLHNGSDQFSECLSEAITEWSFIFIDANFSNVWKIRGFLNPAEVCVLAFYISENTRMRRDRGTANGLLENNSQSYWT